MCIVLSGWACGAIHRDSGERNAELARLDPMRVGWRPPAFRR